MPSAARLLTGAAGYFFDMVALLLDKRAECSGNLTLVQPFHMGREPLVAPYRGILHGRRQAKKRRNIAQLHIGFLAAS